jgi:2-haloacid dehalogenase
VLDFSRFSVLTFDCYGTLIDWERGILTTLRPLLEARGVIAEDTVILRLYAEFEEAAERPPYQSYRTVLEQVVRGFGEHFAFAPSSAELGSLAASLPMWKAFPDSVAALQRLKARFRLGVISNIDDDLFAATSRTLMVPFDFVVTAQSVGSYKPSLNNFQAALERVGTSKQEVLHVAQSLFHDIAPANQLGVAAVWVNRRGAQDGFGAVTPARAHPDLDVADLRTLADLASG